MLFTNKNNSFRCIRESRDRGAWLVSPDSFSLSTHSPSTLLQIPTDPSFPFPHSYFLSMSILLVYQKFHSSWSFLFDHICYSVKWVSMVPVLKLSEFKILREWIQCSCLTAVLWGNSSLDNWNRNSFARDIFPKLIDWTKQVTPKVRTSQYDWCLNIKIRRWTEDFIGYITICICV